MQEQNAKGTKVKDIKISTKDAKHAKYALPDSYNDDVYDDNPSLSGITAYDTLDNKESQPSQGDTTLDGGLDHHTTLRDTYKLNDHQTLCKCTGAGTAKTEETRAAGEAKELKEATVAKVVKVQRRFKVPLWGRQIVIRMIGLATSDPNHLLTRRDQQPTSS